jgi:hypothetical protein
MKTLILLVALASSLSGQSPGPDKSDAPLNIELRANSTRVHIFDEIVWTVVFRSPERPITIWNVLAWGIPTGLTLHVFDLSGHEIQNGFAPFSHPLPPNEYGKGELIALRGKTFAGFDSEFPVKSIFPAPGRYRVRCTYLAPLQRHYFQGQTIWGVEDGPIVSAPVLVEVVSE